MASSAPLTPTYQGHVGSTLDALVLFESCLSGTLNHVPRRPHDRERHELIKSGNVFIYEEHSSGIKRWTDGINWSPSRILGNFLIYRELERPFAPGEKKRAAKRIKKTNGVNKSQGDSRSDSAATLPNTSGHPSGVDALSETGVTKDIERQLIGSLIDSYPFKRNGLVKKTISVSLRGVQHHLVSYYNVEDVLDGKLVTPVHHPQVCGIVPRHELLGQQNFRAALDEIEYTTDENSQGGFLVPYIQEDMGHPGNTLHRAMSLPHNMVGMHPSQLPAPHGGFGVSGVPGVHGPQFATPVTSPMGTVGGYQTNLSPNYTFDSNRGVRFGSNAGISEMQQQFMGASSRRHTAYEPQGGNDFPLTQHGLPSLLAAPQTPHHQTMNTGGHNSDFLTSNYDSPIRSMTLATPQENAFLSQGSHHLDHAVMTRSHALGDLIPDDQWNHFMGSDAGPSHEDNEPPAKVEDGEVQEGQVQGSGLSGLDWMTHMNGGRLK